MRKTVWIIVFVFMLGAAAFAAEGPYKFLKSISIGAEGGWDYLSVDAAARRLYVSHGTKIVVIDMDKDEVVGEIPDLPGVHGFAVAPDLGLGFASNGRENKAAIVDLKTLRVTARVDTGENPDCILYVPAHQEVYTFNGRGKSATVFEAKTGKVIATIPLGGKPEFAVFDPGTDRIYNNIEDMSTVVVLDAKAHSVAATWPLAPGEEASGMAIDLKSHRLFIVAGNKLMVLMDGATGKIVTTVPTGEGTDACVFDPETGLAIASAGEGYVTVARFDAPDKLIVVQTLPTALRARTMTLDPKTHKIYLSTAEFEAPAVPAVVGQPAPRPMMKPETFRVLVYGKEER
ncbi:MAG: YncE family protein [Candidatus Aminicenantales bacterium]